MTVLYMHLNFLFSLITYQLLIYNCTFKLELRFSQRLLLKSIVSWALMPLSAGFLLGLLFDPEDRGNPPKHRSFSELHGVTPLNTIFHITFKFKLCDCRPHSSRSPCMGLHEKCGV
jgi:hypothetical protein